MRQQATKLAAWAGAAGLALALALPAAGHEKEGEKHPPAPRRISSQQKVTIQGELIDPQCYFTHASRGPEHAGCARMCAKGGQDLAFLHEASGIVYPLIATGHGENPNAGWLDHVGKTVRVKGTIYRMHSSSVLMLESVTPM
jgi:hypothetical protein